MMRPEGPQYDIYVLEYARPGSSIRQEGCNAKLSIAANTYVRTYTVAIHPLCNHSFIAYKCPTEFSIGRNEGMNFTAEC